MRAAGVERERVREALHCALLWSGPSYIPIHGKRGASRGYEMDIDMLVRGACCGRMGVAAGWVFFRQAS